MRTHVDNAIDELVEICKMLVLCDSLVGIVASQLRCCRYDDAEL